MSNNQQIIKHEWIILIFQNFQEFERKKNYNEKKKKKKKKSSSN